MKSFLKKILVNLHIYYPLQAGYRSAIDGLKRYRYQKQYKNFEGSGFICNNCGHSYSRFVPWFATGRIAEPLSTHNVIAGYGENIICPNCLSTARERLVLALLQHKYSPANKSILHLAPEKHIYNYLKQHTKVTTADYEHGFYRRIDKNVVYANLIKLPFKDEEFDMVIANHILEHIPADHIAMKEIYRVMKKGGLAILQVPFSKTLSDTIEEPDINDPIRQEELFGQNDHVRIYTADDYVRRLESVGFRVEVLKEDDLNAFEEFAIQSGEWVFLGFKTS